MCTYPYPYPTHTQFYPGTVNAAAADVWSLACLLFVMIKGGPPFSEATEEDEE